MNRQFDFDPIDKPRLATIFSTYRSPIINDEYENFIQHLKLLRINIVKNSFQISPDYSFNFGRIDYKLTQIFLSSILFNTNTEDISHEIRQYFTPVFELFDCCKFSIDLDLFIKICHDLELTVYALHLKQCYQLQLPLLKDGESEEFFNTLWNSIRQCYMHFIQTSDSILISKTKMFTLISDYISNQCYRMIEKVFFIATDGQDNCNHSNEIDQDKHRKWDDNFVIWFFDFMVENIDQYHNSPLFDFILKNLEITIENPIEYMTKAKSNCFWTLWIRANQAIENFDLIFQIITMDKLRSYPGLHRRLFDLSIVVLVYQSVENVSLMRKLFRQRIDRFSLKSLSFIQFNQSHLLLDKQFLDSKLKFDSTNFRMNTIVRQTTFRILYGTFVDPENSLHQIMDQIVMVHSNFLHRYMVHLFGNQLIDILHASSMNVQDVISFSNNEDEHGSNLDLIHKFLLQIIIDKCDLIQMNNLRNLLNNLIKSNLIESERLFTNLMAHFDHESSTSTINYQLKLLKSVPELFSTQKSKWSGKHFALITAYLFDLLLKFWNEPIHRELICDIIDVYLQNCNPCIINEQEIDSLYTLYMMIDSDQTKRIIWTLTR
nr:uncharacterized protein LOC124494945 [Dermatophagoides farinae]